MYSYRVVGCVGLSDYLGASFVEVLGSEIPTKTSRVMAQFLL
jgi:hypothetical protein